MELPQSQLSFFSPLGRGTSIDDAVCSEAALLGSLCKQESRDFFLQPWLLTLPAEETDRLVPDCLPLEDMYFSQAEPVFSSSMVPLSAAAFDVDALESVYSSLSNAPSPSPADEMTADPVMFGDDTCDSETTGSCVDLRVGHGDDDEDEDYVPYTEASGSRKARRKTARRGPMSGCRGRRPKACKDTDSLSSCDTSNFPGISPNNKSALDAQWSEELLSMPTQQLNRLFKETNDFTAADKQMLREARRRRKNRAYAQKSRQKRLTKYQELTLEKKRAQADCDAMAPEVDVLCQQVDQLRQRELLLVSASQKTGLRLR